MSPPIVIKMYIPEGIFTCASLNRTCSGKSYKANSMSSEFILWRILHDINSLMYPDGDKAMIVGLPFKVLVNLAQTAIDTKGFNELIEKAGGDNERLWAMMVDSQPSLYTPESKGALMGLPFDKLVDILKQGNTAKHFHEKRERGAQDAAEAAGPIFR